MLPLLMFLMLAIPVAMTQHVSRNLRRANVQAFDIGIAVVWIVLLYALLPTLGIWLASLGIGALKEQRLGDNVPDADVVQSVATSYVAFMLGFALVYSKLRATSRTTISKRQVSSSSDLRNIFILALAIKLGLLMLRLSYGGVTSDDYISSYLALTSQPLLIRQLFGLLSNIDFAATLLLIVTSTAGSAKLWPTIAFLLTVQIAIAIVGGGSRSVAFLYAFAFMISISIYGRKLPAAAIALIAIIGLATFLLAGLIRSGLDVGVDLLSLQLLQDGEFISVFYNSVDLIGRIGDADLSNVKVGMYLVDILRLIPQQLIGDFKIDPATFYVSTFYPDFSDAGGGLAFGTIAESSIGFGWPESIIRGALLGWLLAFVANHSLSDRQTILRVFVYVWFTVISYQAIRDTTFSIIPRFVYQVMPLLLLIRALGLLKIRQPKHSSARGETLLKHA